MTKCVIISVHDTNTATTPSTYAINKHTVHYLPTCMCAQVSCIVDTYASPTTLIIHATHDSTLVTHASVHMVLSSHGMWPFIIVWPLDDVTCVVLFVHDNITVTIPSTSAINTRTVHSLPYILHVCTSYMHTYTHASHMIDIIPPLWYMQACIWSSHGVWPCISVWCFDDVTCVLISVHDTVTVTIPSTLQSTHVQCITLPNNMFAQVSCKLVTHMHRTWHPSPIVLDTHHCTYYVIHASAHMLLPYHGLRPFIIVYCSVSMMWHVS